MAFKLAQNPTYTVTVKVSTPNDKDTFDTSEFKAKFKRVKFSELESLREKTQVDVIREVLVGFSNLLDDDNKEVDFNESTLNALLEIPQALAALSESFWTSIFKAKEKN